MLFGLYMYNKLVSQRVYEISISRLGPMITLDGISRTESCGKLG